MRILIADDDATSRMVLQATGQKLGHQCMVAEDGRVAWEMLSSQDFDVLLTDWMMPGIDGPELCRLVRSELGSRYIYVVMITGMANPDQVLEGMLSGADDYLIKPVSNFSVQARLIAAERVTALHRQVLDFREQLELANLELLEQSLTDALTGLGNRRRMEDDLGCIHAQAKRSGRGYALALFDIDHFKLFNDHYGHLAGDEVLRSVARCIGATIRAGESFYRYGGEEFLLLLTDCDLTGALDASERLRHAVLGLAIPHSARRTQPSLVTISGGVTSFAPSSTTTLDALLQQADDALFEAKLAGRNRVHATGGASSPGSSTVQSSCAPVNTSIRSG